MMTDINVRVQMASLPQRLEGLIGRVLCCENCEDLEPL